MSDTSTSAPSPSSIVSASLADAAVRTCAPALQHLREQLARIAFVVDDEDADVGQTAAARADLGHVGGSRPDVGGAPRLRRQPHPERRPLALAVALRLDAAAVQLDEVAHDGQTQPETAVPAARAGVGLPEAVEHMRQEFSRNALARVGDDDLDVRFPGSARAHLDAASFGGELDRVRHQVQQDLFQSRRVCDQRRHALRCAHREVDALARCLIAHHRQRRFRNAARIDISVRS